MKVSDNVESIFILTSIFPISTSDKVPSFVLNQVNAFKKNFKSTNIFVIAPAVNGKTSIKTYDYTELRFRYFLKKYENFSSFGFLPLIKKNNLYILVLPFYFLSQLFFTYKQAKIHKPNFIYAHWITPQSVTAFLIYKLTKIPFCFSTHAHDGEIITKVPFLGKFLLNLIVKNSFKFTCDCKNTEKKLKKYVKEKNWDVLKCLILPMGFEKNLLDTEPKIINSYNHISPFKIAYLGRFAEKKGVENLIKVTSELLKEQFDVELIIAGTGLLKSKYAELIETLEIKRNTTIIDFFNDYGKFNYILSLANVVVVPSIITKSGDVEGIPLVALEVMYKEKILIASNESNLGEIIESGKHGFIYSSENLSECKEIIKNLIKNKYDKKYIVQNAKKLSIKYEINQVSKQYFEHLFS